MVIEWGGGFRAWVQRAGRKNNPGKQIIELRRSFAEAPFPGYFAFRCLLSSISLLPSAWVQRLRDVGGVYLLTSLSTRQHYVGSAAGTGGFYERWQQHHAVDGDAHGLKDLIAGDLQISILQVSSGFESQDDTVRLEHAWMRKLWSKSMGLNNQPSTSVDVTKLEPVLLFP